MSTAGTRGGRRPGYSQRRRSRVGARPTEVYAVGGDAVNGPLGVGGHVASPIYDPPSEVAHAIARLVDTLPDVAADQLERLLRNSVGAPPSGLLREARLGLLVEMLWERKAELVGVELYDERRLHHQSAYGEEWASATTLSRAFGSFTRAEIVAGRLAFDGTVSRQPRSYAHTAVRPAYTRAEVLEVVTEMRRLFGVWLLRGEYLEIIELRRRAARASRQPEPRLPTMTPITALFGTYGALLDTARHRFGEPETAGTAFATRLLEEGDPAVEALDEERSSRLHPAAGLYWSVVNGLPEADQRLILIWLSSRHRKKRSPFHDFVAMVMEHYQVSTGRATVARLEYVRWRNAQDNPSDWPSKRAIERAWGSWSRMTDDLGLTPAPDIFVRRLSGRSRPFTRKEIHAGADFLAKRWKRTTREPFRFVDYRAVAIAELRSDHPKFSRFAVSPATICKLCGSWAQTLTDSGHADLVSQSSSRPHHDDDTLLGFLAGWADEAPGPPTGDPWSREDYDAWAIELELELQRTDPSAAVARAATIDRRFGGWDAALLRIGVTNDTVLRRSRAPKT